MANPFNNHINDFVHQFLVNTQYRAKWSCQEDLTWSKELDCGEIRLRSGPTQSVEANPVLTSSRSTASAIYSGLLQCLVAMTITHSVAI